MIQNNIPSEKLREIIDQYGIELIDDPRRCGGLLKDLCGEHKREINLLLLAVRERVPHELLSSASTVPEEIIVARLARGLHEDHGCAEDFARWAVVSWVKALGSKLSFARSVGQKATIKPIPPISPAPPLADTPLTQSTTISQTATPLDGELKQLLFKLEGIWSDPNVWPDIWKQVYVSAGKYGLDERIVRRRIRVLWEEVEPAVIEKKRLEEEERCEKKRLEEEERCEKERLEEQRRQHEEKKRIESEARQNKHVVLLQQWLQKQPDGLWNYAQWDDFLDTLDPPADVTLLEKVRDSIYIDPQTGLMWAKNGNIAGKTMNWYNAINWVNNLNYGGYSDWRLPSKEELVSFTTRGGRMPAKWFNANGFNSVQANDYWSSSSNVSSTGYAWVVGMYDGGVSSAIKGNGNYTWPVRGGQ